MTVSAVVGWCDQMRMERHHDSQRSGRFAITFDDVRVVDRVAASIASLPRLGSDETETQTGRPRCGREKRSTQELRYVCRSQNSQGPSRLRWS